MVPPHPSRPFTDWLLSDPALSASHAPSDNLWALPLTTPTLPPATATNTVFVGRHRPFIVDPATPHPRERERLLHAIDTFTAHDRAPAAIVLTHHHPDHVGAARWLATERHLPIWAHPRTAALLPQIQFDRLLDGDTVYGSEDSDDAWKVLHTPGHASGHVILYEPVSGLIVGGDLVASVGTIVVDPPDGHMATYLKTLHAVRALDARILVPSHGAPLIPPDTVLSHYIAHRLMREDKIRKLLSREPLPLAELTARAYDELDPRLLPLARRAALAHLQKLHEDGEAAVFDPRGAPVEALSPDGAWALA